MLVFDKSTQIVRCEVSASNGSLAFAGQACDDNVKQIHEIEVIDERGLAAVGNPQCGKG